MKPQIQSVWRSMAAPSIWSDGPSVNGFKRHLIGPKKVEDYLPQQDRTTDGDHDDPQRVTIGDGSNGEHLEQGADDRGRRNGEHHGQRQRHAQARVHDAEHPAEHEELTLREVDRTGRGVHDGEPEGHQRVDCAALETGYEELKERGHLAGSRNRRAALVTWLAPTPR